MSAADPFSDLAEVEVLPGWRTAQGDHVAGLRITLADGWKTYWRAPGHAGIPPQFSFTGSASIGSITPHWPTPEVFDQDGFRSVGYIDSVVIPLTLDHASHAEPIALSGEISIGVCEEICIPVHLDFEAVLPPDSQRDTSIAAALIDRPLSAAEANVGAVTCRIAPISDGLQVTTQIGLPSTGMSEHVVIETGDPDIWVSEADVARSGNQLSATVDMVHSSGSAFALDRSALRITVLGSDQAVDIHGCSRS
ncbi:protein-disulfide reductase DsbD domain-containing protein [Yoonia sp. SS1-5]|uniref:Protein-disulfide reductase DsbD domain-containing protein n=1 Tax=Yoonia rhodophyticola TaxID=3137370 RepID=A0AAN0MBS8_9RHOB